ncbi:coiled-coil domain-containing protein 42 homolog [Lampetra fluviatilis]
MSLNLDDYFRTAFAEKLSIRMPERGPHVSGATRLLQLRHEQSAVERALSSTKEEFHMQRESLQQRQEELSHKEAQLKDSLLKFDRFLKENDSKRERAVRKGGEEKVLGLRHPSPLTPHP